MQRAVISVNVGDVSLLTRYNTPSEPSLKEQEIESVNLCFQNQPNIAVERCVEADEQWAFVQNKKQQRWLWYAIEKQSKKVLAFVFGRRTDDRFRALLAKLSVFNIRHYDTDDW